MKVVINRCWGGFGLSNEALALYKERTGKSDIWVWDIPRTDLDLIAVVEELGEDANSSMSCLKVIEIPDNVEWEIQDYDGIESVVEKHRAWY